MLLEIKDRTFTHLPSGHYNYGVLRPDARMHLPPSYLGTKSLSLLRRIGVVGWPTTESPLIFSGIHTVGFLGEILASITMCSPFVHLLVAFYRRIQILLPSLGTLWIVTQERRVIPLCVTFIPLCAPLMS